MKTCVDVAIDVSHITEFAFDRQGNNLGKRRKWLLPAFSPPAFSPLPKMFSKAFFLSRDCFVGELYVFFFLIYFF